MFARAVIVAVVVTALFPGIVRAQSAHAGQLWMQVVETHSLSPEWRVHLELQPRVTFDPKDLDQTIVRTALGRVLSRRVTVWAGHAWIPRTAGTTTRHEQRAWQQLSATFPGVGRWTPSLRIRQEQRFLDGWADSSHRLRVMLRGVRPVGTSRWSLVGWDEVMATFDDTAGGPAQGFDQNRIFGGVLRQMTPKAGLEVGYLWQRLASPNPRPNQHIAFVWLNTTY